MHGWSWFGAALRERAAARTAQEGWGSISQDRHDRLNAKVSLSHINTQRSDCAPIVTSAMSSSSYVCINAFTSFCSNLVLLNFSQGMLFVCLLPLALADSLYDPSGISMSVFSLGAAGNEDAQFCCQSMDTCLYFALPCLLFLQVTAATAAAGSSCANNAHHRNRNSPLRMTDWFGLSKRELMFPMKFILLPRISVKFVEG